MDYFSVLDFDREPFSNSPEPEFFYQSPQHVECLQRLELAVRLRRGLNTVIGDVGAGKTTICRQIIRRFADDRDVETYLILDPSFGSSMEFLRAVVEMLGIADDDPGVTEWHLKEKVKNHLFDRGVGAGKTLVLIIDEGQKIPDFCLEILREFLNYETNTYKLLQIVIFAQKEFYRVLETHEGFADRVNFSYDLHPMNFSDMRAMIRFRLEIARKKDADSDRRVRFTFPALWAIYRTTGGYPRKIIGLCHRIVLALIIRDRLKAGISLVRFCVRGRETSGRSWKVALAAVLGGVLLSLVGFDFGYNLLSTGVPEKPVERVTLKPGDAIAIPVKFPPRDPPVIRVKVPPPAVSSAEAALRHAGEYPESLGWLVVKRDGTICKVIRGVYGGTCTPDRIVSIQKANPHIEDPDRIEPGTMLRLPATPSDCGLGPDTYVVILARSDNLEDAYTIYQRYLEQVPAIQVFPHWNGRDGLRFDVILKRTFDAEEAARSAITEMPPSISSGARIMKGWDQDTVFFSAVTSAA
jgi:general secretion pathway protein A